MPSALSDHPAGPGGPLARVRDNLAHATQQLLGDTIAVTDQQWAEPSSLPGWTRGHVATHLARNADALGRLATWALTGEQQSMYASDDARDAEITSGAGRSGMELQVDLDTSAGNLGTVFEAIEQAGRWNEKVKLRGGEVVPVALLPLSRLSEVVVHHVDLDIGFTCDDLSEDMALWLLQWCGHRLARRGDFPPLTLQPTGSEPVQIGPDAGSTPRTEVSGAPGPLVGWLTSRRSADGLTGADGLNLPSYG